MQLRAPLLLAALSGNECMVCLLLALGADPAAVDGSGATALHLLAQAQAPAGSSTSAIEVLLRHHAPLGAVDGSGQAPLHAFAARPGPAAAPDISALLDAGADPYLADASGQTPLGCALAAGNQPAVELLLLAGGRWLSRFGGAQSRQTCMIGCNYRLPVLLRYER